MSSKSGIEREIERIDRELLKLTSRREMLVWELGGETNERPFDGHKPLQTYCRL
jgi:hypothetical protein